MQSTRTFLEEKMAEATLRRCPNQKCRKPYERRHPQCRSKISFGAGPCFWQGRRLQPHQVPLWHPQSGPLQCVESLLKPSCLTLAPRADICSRLEAATCAVQSWTRRGPTTTTRPAVCAPWLSDGAMRQDGHLGGGKNDSKSKCIVCGSQASQA